MLTPGTARPDDRLQDNWPEFLKEVQIVAADNIKGKSYVYQTDATNLQNLYLNSLPEGRQHYNCNACLMFLSRYGGLVVINDDLSVTPLFWSKNGSKQKYFDDAVKNLYKAVKEANIKNVFKPEELTLGIPENVGSLTGYRWTHFNFVLPNRIFTALNNPEYLYLERYQMLERIAAEIKTSTIDEAISLINSGVVYRGAEDLPMLNTIRPFIEKILSSKNKKTLMWTMLFEHESLYHLRASALYTFLDDLAHMDDVDKAIENYGYKKDPANYGRVKSEVSTSQIKIAKKAIEDMGLINALDRRFAKFSDIPVGNFVWFSRSIPVSPDEPVEDGFSKIKPKTRTVADGQSVGTEAKMTWQKFAKTILPTAQEISVVIDNPSRLMGLTTEAVPDAGSLLMWKNPFDWYYNGGGADGEMRKRVIEAGGKYEDNDIRCSLMWNTCTDLDLHCITPTGAHIYYGDKKPRGQEGWLDVDMNAGGCHSTKPVENIRFAKGKHHVEGTYLFYVYNYANRNSTNAFKVELEVHGRLYAFEGDLTRTGDRINVFQFTYTKNNVVMNGKSQFVAGSAWGFDGNNSLKVRGILPSPNVWDDVTLKQSHIFFLLDGVKHNGEGAIGFLPEHLSAAVKPHRKVLEHYALNNPVKGIDSADAFGVGFNQDSDWNLKLQVKTGKLTQTVVIDRYE